MPLTTSFEPSQVIGQASVLIIEDTSTGTDIAVTERRVFLQKSDGTYLTPSGTATDYISWPMGDTSIEIDALDRDYALFIIVRWCDVDGNSLYTESELWLATLYLKQFYYDLTQTQTGTPNIVNDAPYYISKIQLRCAIDEAINAVEVAGDHHSAQAALDRGQFLVDHQTLYF